MSINVIPTEGGSFTLTPAGQYQAVCCEVLDLGFKDKVYKNQKTGADEPRTVHEIQYVFQLNKVDEETGKRFEVRSRPLNLVLSEKASLRAFLLQWRGHDLTEAEAVPPGVDVDLTGRNAAIQVVHAKVGDKIYANIGSIMPLMEGMPEIQPLNYEPKQAMVDAKIAQGDAAEPTHSGTPQIATAAAGGDDIPF